MGIFNRLFARRNATFHRAAERFDCRIEARLQLCDSGVVYEGRLDNMSLGGAMFRPRLAYLLERHGSVLLYLGNGEIEAEIVATTPRGYGLRFTAPIDEARLHKILALQTDPVPA